MKSRRLDLQGSTASGKVTPHLRQSRDIPPAKASTLNRGLWTDRFWRLRQSGGNNQRSWSHCGCKATRPWCCGAPGCESRRAWSHESVGTGWRLFHWFRQAGL